VYLLYEVATGCFCLTWNVPHIIPRTELFCSPDSQLWIAENPHKTFHFSVDLVCTEFFCALVIK
jgi:hypothetical protein